MSGKMNVVHLIPSLAFDGGAENVVFNLLGALDRERFRPVVFYWGERDDLSRPLLDKGVVVRRLSFEKVVSWASVRRIAYALRAENANILHTHFLDADLLGFWAARLNGIPQVVSIHSRHFPQNQRHAWRYRLLSPWISRFICVSKTVSDRVRKKTGIAADKITFVRNGVDVSRYSAVLSAAERNSLRLSLGLGLEDIVVGNVSRLVPDKGQEFLIQALPEILKVFPRVRLLLVGDGALKEVLKGLAFQRGVADKVFFVGKRKDVPALLGVMDLFVFPAVNEGFGLAIVEAMAAGLPVVAAGDAGAKEVVTHDRDGLLVSPADAVALARAVILLLTDRALALRLGEEARRRAEGFSIEAMTRGYEAVYGICCSVPVADAVEGPPQPRGVRRFVRKL